MPLQLPPSLVVSQPKSLPPGGFEIALRVDRRFMTRMHESYQGDTICNSKSSAGQIYLKKPALDSIWLVCYTIPLLLACHFWRSSSVNSFLLGGIGRPKDCPQVFWYAQFASTGIPHTHNKESIQDSILILEYGTVLATNKLEPHEEMINHCSLLGNMETEKICPGGSWCYY